MASGSKIVNATYSASGTIVCDALKFSWWENSQSVADNSTVVGWKLELIAYEYGYINSSAKKNWSVTVNGQKDSGTNTIGIADNSTRTLASGTTTIAHNANGAKSFSYSFSQEFSITFHSYIGTVSGSGTGTLTTIPRASQPSLDTYPENTQNVGNFGDTISVHMNRKSPSFTHKVRYEFGSMSGTCIDADTGKAATAVTNGFKWKIPLEFMNLLPTSRSGSGRVFVDTYNGSTLIGTKYSGFTATVPSSVSPSCSIALTDTAGMDKTYGDFVQGLSNIKVTVTPTLAYGSPIERCSISIDGRNFNGTTATTGLLRKSGAQSASASVIDGRNGYGFSMASMTVLPYAKPAVTKLTVIRCNQDGTANKRGAYLKATFSAVISPLNDINTATYSIKYKKSSDTAYTTVSLSTLANNYAPTNQTYIFAASTGDSYDVVITAKDRHNTTTRSAKGQSGFAIFSWRGFKNSSGTYEEAAGIGKVPDKANTLQVGWDAEFDNKATFADELVCRGNQYAFSSPGVANTAGYVRIARLTHKKPNADTPITFVLTRRLAASPMTVHVQFESSNETTDPGLKGITYEGSNYGAYLVHSAASVWELYVLKATAFDTITLQHWFSSGTVWDRLTVDFPGGLAESLPSGLDGYYTATPTKLRSLLDHIYPINSIYISYGHTSPAELFGGTWARIENRVLWGTTEGGIIGQTGGSQTHTHGLSGGYAEINFAASSTSVFWNRKSASYSTNHLAGSGKATAATAGSASYGTALGGSTDSTNHMPPYIQVSIWRRTA